MQRIYVSNSARCSNVTRASFHVGGQDGGKFIFFFYNFCLFTVYKRKFFCEF